MKGTVLKVRVSGTDPILGSIPRNKELYTKYIATKAASTANEGKAKGDVENVVDANDGTTGFYRDLHNYPVLKGYQFKGFLKEAAKALKGQLKLGTPASKIDNFVFVKERDIPLFREDGSRIEEPDGFLERPLRAETMQGPRVSLAKSEIINPSWVFEITLEVIANEKTAKSPAVDADLVKSLLDYGERKGLLQWRNARYGCFTYEILDEYEM